MQNVTKKSINPFLKTIAGVELWRGPSAFDGEEIVVIATFRTENIKTGELIQIWMLGADSRPTAAMVNGKEKTVCGSCPLQHGSSGGNSLCYVNRCTANKVYDTWKTGGYPKYNRGQHLHLFSGRHIRLGAYGDPAMVPLSLFKPLLAVASGWTGYTHQWRLGFAQEYRTFVMASTESEKSYWEAKQAGWRSFRIRRPDEPTLPQERVCPASEEGGFRVQCNRCMACHGARTEGRADLSVLAHGGLFTPERFTQLSIAGKF